MENVNSIKEDVYIPLQEKWILAIRLQVLAGRWLGGGGLGGAVLFMLFIGTSPFVCF